MNYLDLIDDVKEEQIDIKEKFIKEQMEAIRWSRENNFRSACWLGYKSEYQAVEPEVRRMFYSKEYRVKATGYVGGVWQDSEDICW